MYFNLWKKFVKRKKIRKKFINFCMGRCGIRSCRFSQRFKQISKHELAISLAIRKQSNLYTNEIASSCFEICWKSGKSESRIVPCKNLANLQNFFVFFSFYKFFPQVKLHLVYKKNIVDFISVIILT